MRKGLSYHGRRNVGKSPAGSGTNPFFQSGPTLDLVFAGVATDPLDTASTTDDTLNLAFLSQTYQVAAQYAIWVSGSGLQAKTFSDIVTFSRTGSTATYFNSAGVLTTAAADVPRFDYDPSTLSALGLLIEEQRTNLLLQSADFTTTWTQTNVTITANSTASPDGGTNGDTLLINAAGATTSQTSQSFTAGSTITVSVFAKKNASNFVRFEVGGLVNCWFDLNTGVTGTNGAGSGNVLFSAKSIQAISNGWYRCVLTVTTSTITTLGVNIFATNADNVSSSIGSSIFLWGAQLEAGAFPTSYIPTTTTALTRSADVASVNTLSPWFNASTGTLFTESLLTRQNATSDNQTANIRNPANISQIKLVYRASGATGQIVVDTSVNQADLTATGVISANTTVKMALAYAANDFAASGNGGAVVTDTSGTVPSGLDQMTLGQVGLNGYLRRITYYPRRLANADLQTITT